jgi:hypothetical protein
MEIEKESNIDNTEYEGLLKCKKLIGDVTSHINLKIKLFDNKRIVQKVQKIINQGYVILKEKKKTVEIKPINIDLTEYNIIEPHRTWVHEQLLKIKFQMEMVF